MILDKIYCGNDGHGNLSFSSSLFDSASEYIRKDALMEWAKQKQYESLTIVADNFWQEVIDKLNSL